MKTFNQSSEAIAKEIAQLLVSKQLDYGPKNILNSPFGAEHGIVVRLFDKVARMANLLKNGEAPNNESIEDTWKDIAGYAIIALMVRKEEFELPLEK